MATMSAAGQRNNHSSVFGGDGLYTPYLTLVLPNTTIVSALPAHSVTSKVSTPTVAPITPEDEQAYLHSHTPNSDANVSPANSINHRIDFERLKFRIVFILWPAIVGITMAI